MPGFIPILTNLAISFAAGYAAEYFSARPQERLYRPDLRATGTGKRAGQIIYGKPWATGSIIYANVIQQDLLGASSTLFTAVALAAHKVVSFGDVQFDGNTFRPDWDNADLSLRGEVATGDYAEAVRGLQHLGDSSQQTDEHLDFNFSEWTAEHRGREIAYASFHIRINEDTRHLFNGYPNQIRVQVTGKKVYDPRLDTAPGANPTSATYQKWSANPALCALDYMIDPLGMDLDHDEIHWESFSNYADNCDGQVESATSGLTAARL